MPDYVYVAWHKADQSSSMPVNGTFLSSSRLDITSGAASTLIAPADARYAEVWGTTGFYARRVTGTDQAVTDGTAKPFPAGMMCPIYGVTPGETKISAIKLPA